MAWTNSPQARSMSCNGELLRYFRTYMGWTQQQLADRAGYTKRLIAKAEAGGSLHPDTIEVLAEALSSPARPIYPEDLITAPRELAAAFLRAYAESEQELVAKCRHFLADNMQGYFPGGEAAAPLSGLHNSIDEYDEFCHNFFRIFQRPDKKLALSSSVIASDGNRAFIHCFERICSRLIPHGDPPESIMLHLVFSKGKLAGVQHIFDPTVVGQIVTMWRENRPGQIRLYPERYARSSEFGIVGPAGEGFSVGEL